MKGKEKTLVKDPSFSFERYNDGIHMTGRICLSIGLIMLLGAPFLIAELTGAEIIWDGFGSSVFKVLLVYIPSCIAEYLIYVPLLGAGACYLAFITGNITNLKLPCAFNARELTHAEVGSPESEIISTLSVAVSSLVTMLVIFIGVLLLIPLTPILENPVIKPAFDNVLPALFGSLGLQYFSKSWKLSAFPIFLMSMLCIFVPSLIRQTSTMLILIGGLSIGLGFLMWRKGKLPEEN